MSEKARRRTDPPWWVKDVLLAFVIGLVLLLGQAWLDDRRADREARREALRVATAERLENLRFVRERSSTELQSRPFSGFDLRDQSLSGLALDGADFSNAEMFEVNLVDTSLRGADLTSADLDETLLAETDLSGADLRGATFEGASLIGVNLSGAVLTSVTADLDAWGSVCYDDTTVWPSGYEPPPPRCDDW